jgi:hypothetical protein
MARPQVELTPEQIAQVETLASVLSQEQIADYLGIAKSTFQAILDRDPVVFGHYKKGKSKAIASVAQGLLKKALSGDTASAIFYLKTQAGWKETNVQEHTGANGSALQPPVFNIVGVSPKDED